ncbi:LptF/LptG family permease [Mucilaginibacter sp. AW1-3]
MKKIHLLILKAFIRPFIVTFLIVMFVLLMLFLWKYIDDLIGKGFQWYTILQLMLYASATNVAMALPLSVLLSSIMTYGTLGENYELVAIKAAGVSLSRALYPMIIVVAMLSISAFVFSDYMLPVANLKFYSLLYDVRKQKSASLIKVNVFNNSFPGYSIRVGGKDPDDRILYNIMIYEKNLNYNSNNVIFARQGEMFKSPNNKFLVLKLKDGVKYEEASSNQGAYNPRQTFTRFRFKETTQKLSLSGFELNHTPQAEFKGAYAMLSSGQLLDTFAVVKKTFERTLSVNYAMITPYSRYFTMPHKATKIQPQKIPNQHILSTFTLDRQIEAVTNAGSEANSIKDIFKSKADAYREQSSVLRRYLVEYQKKFTLSAACLVLFLIGAPLGAIIRKGGLGLPVVISVVFFLIYYIISTIGEKAAKDGSLSPVIGTWVAILVLTPIGIFLSYKSANDSVLFDLEAYKRFFVNLLKKKATKADELNV